MDFWLFHIIWKYYAIYCVKEDSSKLDFPPGVYWTRWGEAISTVYSVISFLSVAIAAIEQRSHKNKSSCLEKITGILMQISSTHALMITACYFIVKPEGKGAIFDQLSGEMDYSSFYSHVLNSVVTIIDILLIAMPRPFMHFLYSSIFLICYTGVNFLFWWNLGIVVYKPMDWGWWIEKGKIPEAVFASIGMFFIVVPIFHGFLRLWN